MTFEGFINIILQLERLPFTSQYFYTKKSFYILISE